MPVRLFVVYGKPCCLFFCWHLSNNYALLERVNGCARHPDADCALTRFVSRTKKCRNFHSIVSLRSNFEIHNNNKPFSSMSQSESIGWVKQNTDNNCQTTRIVNKRFVQFFSNPSVYIYIALCHNCNNIIILLTSP